jgi:large subunit ribosomal protein L6
VGAEMTTSRVGRKPITIPAGVEVLLNGHDLSIKGPKGHKVVAIHNFVQVQKDESVLTVRPNDQAEYCRTGSGSKLKRAITGTTRAKIANIIHGVAEGFERKLILVGVGYRAQTKGNILNLTIGFSHPVNFAIPEGIVIETPSLTEIIIKGIDKHLVGHTAAKIRAFRGPEPYKGKGIRYANEKIVLKETKKK